MKIKINRSCDNVSPRGFYVYVHRRPSDGSVFYVGKGSRGRIISTHDRNAHWNRVAKKDGVDAYVVQDGLSEVCAFSLEVALIRYIGVENLCNYTSGGEGASGYKMSQRQIERNREAQKGLQSGSKNPMFGKKHTQEALDKMSKAQSGRKWTKEQRAKIERTRSKRPHPNKGRVWPSDVREKIGASRRGVRLGEKSPMYDSRKLKFTHKDGEVYIGTAYDFCNKYSQSRSNVSMIVNHYPNRTVKGWSISPAHDE